MKKPAKKTTTTNNEAMQPIGFTAADIVISHLPILGLIDIPAARIFAWSRDGRFPVTHRWISQKAKPYFKTSEICEFAHERFDHLNPEAVQRFVDAIKSEAPTPTKTRKQ